VVNLLLFCLHVVVILGKTNKEFNLRHDWNSLLSDDETLRMTKYSKRLYPKADVLVNINNPFSTTIFNHHLQPPSSTTIFNHHPQPPS
jgi:hypothetical protein